RDWHGFRAERPLEPVVLGGDGAHAGQGSLADEPSPSLDWVTAVPAYTPNVARIEELPAQEAQLEWDTPLFRTALAQFEQAIPFAEINESIVERLRYPERAVMVAVPIRRDEGHIEVFPAYRVQHSTVL